MTGLLCVCFCTVLCGALSAVCAQTYKLTKRVAALEAERDIAERDIVEKDIVEKDIE